MGRFPFFLLCFGLLFLLATLRGPRTGQLQGVTTRERHWGVGWLHPREQSRIPRTTLQSREKDGYKRTERCYTQNCARIADVWPGGTSQNCCVGIFLSTDDRWCEGSLWCPASGATLCVCVFVCLKCWCETRSFLQGSSHHNRS